MKLTDTHCHINHKAFDDDREKVIFKAKQVGVKQFIVPATTANQWQSLIQLTKQHSGLFYALGLHPYFIDEHQQKDLIRLKQMIRSEKPIAIGEIGLDFYHKPANKNQQLFIFNEQLNIAASHQLPVIIHARKSYDEILLSLQSHSFSQGGFIHAFNGSIQQAHKFIELNFKLGFGGMITYDRSSKLRKLVKCLPLNSIVLETDSPDMTGFKHQGQRNSPEYLPEVFNTLVQLRNETKEKIASTIHQNIKAILPDLDR